MQIILEPPVPPETAWVMRILNAQGHEVELTISDTYVSMLSKGTLEIQTYGTNEVEVQFPFQEVLP